MDYQTHRQLPEAHFVQDPETGHAMPVTEPCYRLAAEGFYGNTLYNEGETIVTHMCPNQTMEPLNQAAEAKYNEWLESLPTANLAVTIQDMEEAIMTLRNHPSFPQMDREQIGRAAARIAVDLRQKRDAKNGMSAPRMHGVVKPGTSRAPAMANLAQRQANIGGFGAPREAVVTAEPWRAPEVARSVAPPMPTPAQRG